MAYDASYWHFQQSAQLDAGRCAKGTASFGASTITGLTFLVPSTIGGFTFNAGAPAYSFNVPVVGSMLFTGAGITNNSSNSPNFFLAPTATLVFENNSSAGNATFTNAVGGTLTFQDTSSAGSATINNNGSAAFIGNSTAASAAITNNGLLTFGGASTAANATVQTANGGVTQFLATAAGGQARFVTDAGGAFSIVLASNPVTVGSIEGAGRISWAATSSHWVKQPIHDGERNDLWAAWWFAGQDWQRDINVVGHQCLHRSNNC